MSLCDRDMRIRQIRIYVISFVNFHISTASETYANYSTNVWTTASRFFTIEPAFCEGDKNHKFDNFKTHKNLFFNEVAFYFI